MSGRKKDPFLTFSKPAINAIRLPYRALYPKRNQLEKIFYIGKCLNWKMVHQRQRQESKKCLYIQKNLRSSIVRLSCSSRWRGSKSKYQDQFTAAERRQRESPTPKQITGSSPILLSVLWWRCQSLGSPPQIYNGNRDPWWLLCELPQ